MLSVNAFVCFLILVNSDNTISRPIAPVHFEFQHHESLSISDTDDYVEEDYDYDDPVAFKEESSSHIRKRRSVKWSPNYDLYEQWAEEYYSQNEAAQEKAGSLVNPKETLLDKLINKAQNKTKEEIEIELKEQQQRREILKSTLMYGSWTIGIVMTMCCFITFVKKCWKKFACDFCDAFTYKDKITQLVNNLAPGIYVHKDGTREYYTPTKEEMEAVRDIQKILFSLA